MGKREEKGSVIGEWNIKKAVMAMGKVKAL